VTPRLLLIVNPRSANRSTGRNWRKLRKRLREVLPPFRAIRTAAPGDAARFAAKAAGRYDVVVAVGGDGTIGEVANGLLANGAGGTALGLLPRGTGSDFVRTLEIPRDMEEAAALLAQGNRRQIDVGRATFTDFDGERSSRWFVNAAEVGMGAMVCREVNRAKRRLSGQAAFWWAILTTLRRYTPAVATVVTDDSPARELLLNNAWIANGCYSGGGMRTAPRARLDDGLLDAVLVEQASGWRRLAGLPKLRNGTFVDMPEVDYRQAARVEFAGETPIMVETDGDAVGTTPATFECLPGHLTVVA
jgi:YegS/Rv2252/BmrU family lipid kinase